MIEGMEAGAAFAATAETAAVNAAPALQPTTELDLLPYCPKSLRPPQPPQLGFTALNVVHSSAAMQHINTASPIYRPEPMLVRLGTNLIKVTGHNHECHCSISAYSSSAISTMAHDLDLHEDAIEVMSLSVEHNDETTSNRSSC